MKTFLLENLKFLSLYWAPGIQRGQMAGLEECEGFTVIGSNFGGGGVPGSDGAGKKVRRSALRASGCTAHLDFDHPALRLGRAERVRMHDDAGDNARAGML